MNTWEERMTRRPVPEPRLELLETCWQFVGPSKRTLTCGIYGTDAGLEVRVGYGADDLLYSQRVVDQALASEIAAQLRKTVIEKGGFTEVATGISPSSDR
jgi:hypothetical protein